MSHITKGKLKVEINDELLLKKALNNLNFKYKEDSNLQSDYVSESNMSFIIYDENTKNYPYGFRKDEGKYELLGDFYNTKYSLDEIQKLIEKSYITEKIKNQIINSDYNLELISQTNNNNNETVLIYSERI